jgi:predicted nucleic acid-binding protein
VIFLDTSAAAKRYFQEAGSDRVNALCNGRELVSSLVLLQCELTSTLNRKRRERTLPVGAYHTIKRQVLEDVAKINAVPIEAGLLATSLRLLDTYPLKTLDALYLAGALGLQRDLGEIVQFVASDRQLLHAARAEGLRAIDPETAP